MMALNGVWRVSQQQCSAEQKSGLAKKKNTNVDSQKWPAQRRCPEEGEEEDEDIESHCESQCILRPGDTNQWSAQERTNDNEMVLSRFGSTSQVAATDN